MALHVYVKEKKSIPRKLLHAASYIALVSGALLMFWAYYPIISFELYSRMFITQAIASPVPETNAVTSLEPAKSLYGNYDVFSSNLRDFVQASIWFPSQKQQISADKIRVKDYTISIPRLNIMEAKVKVGGDDLSKSLIHYLPVSLPGEYGNVAIFGHSTLPTLYNAKDYKTIFTYLPSLEKGDKIVVNIENKKYTYEVFDMFIVKPDQISVLEQKLDASYLTVITCVPPGTYEKRLVVRAKLMKIPDL